jgi:hypothetical protein
MPEPTARKATETQDEDHLIDETLPMPALAHFLEASETPGPVPAADIAGEHLQRLIALAESIDSRLDQIAELLAEQGRRGRARTKRKTSRKSSAKKT